MPHQAGEYTFKIKDAEARAIAYIAEILGYDLNKRGTKARIIREALHYYAAKLLTPSCPDCGTDLVPILDEEGDPTGRWYCPGCID